MPRTVARALPLAGLAVLAAVPAAHAGAPGTWTQLTTPLNGSSTDTVSLARTPDGILHVAFERRSPANTSADDVAHATVAPNGQLLATTLIADAWNGISEVALLAEPTGLRAVVGGGPGLSPGPGMRTLTAPLDGSIWSLSDVFVATGTNTHIGPMDATLAPDGSLITLWGETGLKTHRGLAALADANGYPVLQSACCAYNGGLATSPASGQVWAAWYSNANRPDNPSLADAGWFYQALDPATGAPAGEKRKAPLSGVASGGEERAVSPSSAAEAALVALQGGQPGVLLAYGQGYPTIERVRVADLASGTVRTVPASRRAGVLALAADASGRAWLALGTTDERIVVRRSNVGASVWGAPVTVRPPKGTGSIWTLQADAQAGVLDLVATVQTAGSGAWHTQVRPGLTLTAKPLAASSRTGGIVTFTVTDAGVPVAGAKVKVGSRTLTTNAKGVARLVVKKGAARGQRAVSATRAGYAGASAVVRIKR